MSSPGRRQIHRGSMAIWTARIHCIGTNSVLGGNLYLYEGRLIQLKRAQEIPLASVHPLVYFDHGVAGGGSDQDRHARGAVVRGGPPHIDVVGTGLSVGLKV